MQGINHCERIQYCQRTCGNRPDKRIEIYLINRDACIGKCADQSSACFNGRVPVRGDTPVVETKGHHRAIVLLYQRQDLLESLAFTADRIYDRLAPMNSQACRQSVGVGAVYAQRQINRILDHPYQPFQSFRLIGRIQGTTVDVQEVSASLSLSQRFRNDGVAVSLSYRLFYALAGRIDPLPDNQHERMSFQCGRCACTTWQSLEIFAELSAHLSLNHRWF